MDVLQGLVLAASSAAAGAINAVAGGGTLVSFPAAVAVGLDPVVANATNAVAMTPGSLASAWGYRRELAQDRSVVKLLSPPSLLGGLVGSVLLLVTPQRVFDAVVPALILVAAGLLLWQNLRPAAREPVPVALGAVPGRNAGIVLLHFLVGMYGGYFGAGLGIMTLAILGLLGGQDIHRMNGVKMVLGGLVNGAASAVFLCARAVDLSALLVMTAGAMSGGWMGAALARRVNPRRVRWLVVGVGFLLAALFAWRHWGPVHPAP